MTSNTIQRLGTANMYDSAIRNLSQRQSDLSNQQEQLTSGKRVVRPSDDPVASAQAERAMTRISRIKSEQAALAARKDTISQAESSLGDAETVMQSIRTLLVQAGGGSLTVTDRQTIVTQLQSLREQLSSIANAKDANGVPLFSALGSSTTPFGGPLSGNPDYAFNGQAGQTAASGASIPGTLDGSAGFMFNPQRDGVYAGTVTMDNGGGTQVPIPDSAGRSLTTSGITPTNPSLVTGHSYAIQFSGVGPTATPGAPAGTYTATYTITDATTNTVVGTGTVPDYDPAKPLTLQIPDASNTANASVPGLSFSITTTPGTPESGTIPSPADGDTVTISPSASIFSTIDAAIKGIGNAASGNDAIQAVGQALNNLDIGANNIHMLRGYAGAMMNRADSVSNDQDNRSTQLQAARSNAEDLDMVQGIANFQTAQTGYQAALKSYAQVQQMSLFNFMS
ncbi:MAG: flagellar hook-associated protein FlgL [Acidovorax sp.]